MVRQLRQLPYLPKFSDRLTLSQPGGEADYAHPLSLPQLKNFRDYTPENVYVLWFSMIGFMNEYDNKIHMIAIFMSHPSTHVHTIHCNRK